MAPQGTIREERGCLFKEVFNGRFERTFTNPEGIKPGQVKATFNAGVLEITMPAEGLEAMRSIAIEPTEGLKKAGKAA